MQRINNEESYSNEIARRVSRHDSRLHIREIGIYLKLKVSEPPDTGIKKTRRLNMRERVGMRLDEMRYIKYAMLR